ncbi:MAG TPA: hypothetical protein VGI50_08615 [Solirubrobacteraceae bacterium]
MHRHGVRGLLRLGALLATAFALAGAAPHAAAARLPSCDYRYFSGSWAIGSEKFTLLRTGTWTSYGSNVTATETDAINPVTRGLTYPDGLYLQQLCSPWNLSLNTSNAVADLFTRAGSQAAKWSTTEPGSGGCSPSRSFPADAQEGFVLSIGGAPTELTASFGLRAKQVRLFVNVNLPPGLSCRGPLGPATFDYPRGYQVLVSSPIVVPAATLAKDRAFSLSFSGSATDTEPWDGGLYFGPIGTERFRLTWSGTLSFRPTGCAQHSAASTRTFRACYPG